ncbi:MAG: hypothetical protein IJH28_05435 [Mogibacterium sp.]|nr:hypothetical protein [Mogibacterium sp.]
MTLASMINFDEDALICDLAETYHIYDYRSLPVKLVATLSAGLRDDSRIKMSAAGVPAAQDTLLLATIADRVEAFRYGFSEDASKGTNRPISIIATIFGEKPEGRNKSGVMSFATHEEFEATLARIRGE